MRTRKIYVMGVDQMILPLTKHFAQEGSIPTIARLLEHSSAYEALASFPCYTANNWPVIATGAQTGTHGAVSWFIRMPDGEDVPSLASLGINAEFIWEAAERQGLRSAVLHYPGSMPSHLKKGYVIDGVTGPAFGGCPFELATAEAYATHPDVQSPALNKVVLEVAEGWKGLPGEGPQPLSTPIPITAKEDKHSQCWQAVVLGGASGYDRVVVCREKDLATSIAETKLNQWSQWSIMPFEDRQGTVRFKLTALSPDGKFMKLYRSQIMPLDGFSEPDQIGRELIDKIGPYQEHVSQMFDVLGIVDYTTCVEEADYQGQWFAKAALYLTKEKGCDLFFCHWHFLDAELIGLWGDQVGDIVVVLESGSQMGKKDSPTPLQDNTALLVSGHGRMLPTNETVFGTERAIFTIAGPGVKKGYERPAEKLGHVRLIDVAPTLCHLLGIQPPAQSQGAIIYDLLEGHEMVRERPRTTPQYEPTRKYKKWWTQFREQKELLAEESIPC